MPNDSKKKLAVIDNGADGHRITYDLCDKMAVTLIDPKTYREVAMAFPRVLVEPRALPARLSYSGFMGAVRNVQGRAISMTDHCVDPGSTRETVSFNYVLKTANQEDNDDNAAQSPVLGQASPRDAGTRRLVG